MSLTENRNTAYRPAVLRAATVADAAIVFAGGLTAINAAGKAVPASGAAGLKVMGRAERYGVAGDVINIMAGCCAWDLADGETATIADIGSLVYAVDDCTVSLLPGDNAIVAGEIFDVDDEGVWVITPAGGRPGADGDPGADGADGSVSGGIYTAVADDATATSLTIDTGLDTVTSYVVQIRRAGVLIADDAAVSEAAGVLTVANGSTYTITADDKIHWLAAGTVAAE